MQATLLKCVPAVAVLAMVFGCAVNNGSAAGPTNDPAVRKAIESADSGFAVAFKNADAAAAAGYYSDDAASRPPNAEPLIGKAGIAKGYGDLFKSLGTVVDVSATAKDVDIYADHAVEVGSTKKRRPVGDGVFSQRRGSGRQCAPANSSSRSLACSSITFCATSCGASS